MQLNDLLDALDRTAANLAKLEAVWARASPLLPTGPWRGSIPEYDDLCRAWADLLPGLQPVDGWTITNQLPDADELGQAFIDYFEISEPPHAAWDAAEQPGKDLAEYRHRLNRARRRATRQRLQELIQVVDLGLREMLARVPRDATYVLEDDLADELRSSIAEIERLMADTAERRGRWSDLHRHMHFGQGHDWHDVQEFDWPTVLPDIEAGALADADPLPVPNIDLGVAASGQLTGTATVGLAWSKLDDDGFERLLYDLLRDISDYDNVQWLTKTRAPDRGRDLSLDRVLRDGSGAVRTERVMVQAKHWQSRSVAAADVHTTIASAQLWRPIARGLLIVTSGRFTTDAISYAEQHNDNGHAPLVDLWPDSRLETLLASRPALVAAHGLR